MSTVFLLGAGASKAFEYPTTVEFMDIAEKKKLPNPFSEVVAFLKKKRKSIDIEMVLGELRDYQEFMQELQMPGRYKEWFFLHSGRLQNASELTRHSQNIEQLSREINKLVYDTYWKEPNEDAKDTYRKLAGSFTKPLDIFTTNYDLCIEHAFTDDNFDDKSFTDGFSYYYRKIQWNEALFDGSLIRLYKLHGSVNWKRGPTGELWKTSFSDRTEERDHVILYPGFKGEPDEEPFIFLHKAFSDKISSCQRLIVIGFSFRDEYINQIINRASKQNKAMKMIIWNPVIPDHPFPSDVIVPFDKPFGKDYIQEVVNLRLPDIESRKR